MRPAVPFGQYMDNGHNPENPADMLDNMYKGTERNSTQAIMIISEETPAPMHQNISQNSCIDLPWGKSIPAIAGQLIGRCLGRINQACRHVAGSLSLTHDLCSTHNP